MGLNNSYEDEDKSRRNKNFEQYIKDIKSGKKQIEVGTVTGIDTRGHSKINLDGKSMTYSFDELMASYILSKMPSKPQITFWKSTYRRNNS
jgi:hypothetical protein